MEIIYINARSLLKNIEKIEQMINKLNPFMLMCTETRITSEIQQCEYEIKNYKPIVCLSENRHTGGAIIYIKQEIKYRVILIENIKNAIWCVAIEVWNCEADGIYSVIYRSPNKENNMNIFMKDYDNILNKIIKLNKMNVITGDINIDMLKINGTTDKIKDLYIKHGLTLKINFVTRENNGNGTLIDVVLTNKTDKIECTEIEDEIISDHKTIKITVKCEKRQKIMKKMRICWKNYTKIKLIENIRTNDWSHFYSLSLNDKVKMLREKLFDAVYTLTEMKEIKCKVKNHIWFDEQLKNMKKRKVDKYMEWLKNGKQSDIWTCYVNIRNEYNKIIKIRKANYHKTEIKNARNDQIKIWKCLRGIISKNTTTNSPNEIIFDDEISTNETNICEKFNEFFVNSIMKINREIPTCNDDNYIINRQNENEFKFTMVNVEQIEKVTRKLTNKINKSVYCNSMVWNDAVEYVGHFITNIINESFETGIFPNDWKLSTITPIPKITNTNKACEHRPINTRSNDEKIIENVAKAQLVEWMETNSILASQQSAFRKMHSCETALNDLTYEWKMNMERGNVTVAVFLDLRRAFETVDRNRMLMKLEAYGVRNVEAKWFKNYMHNMRQRTKYKDAVSNEINVNIGIPQGTALSVILFNLYINDIVNVPRNGKIKLFADDTEIETTGKNAKEAMEKMNEDLRLINEWLNINKLSLNYDKTKCMIIYRNKIDENVEINVNIDGKMIERVNYIKYLGFLIDDKLNMHEQITRTTKKIASKINFLKRSSRKLTYETRILIYNAIVLPHFNYCSTLYIMCTKEQIKKLQKLQSRAMRIIIRCEYRTPRKNMLEVLNWLSVTQLIVYNVLLFMYKIKNNLVPQYIITKINRNIDITNRNTRQQNEFRIPLHRFENTKNNVIYKGIKMFNEMPNEIKNAETLNLFKLKCKQYVKLNIEIN